MIEVIDGTEVGVYTQSGSPETTVVLPGEPFITATHFHRSQPADPEFSIDATLAPETGGLLPQGCRVRGGNDHVGFVCDTPFDEFPIAGDPVTVLIPGS